MSEQMRNKDFRESIYPIEQERVTLRHWQDRAVKYWLERPTRDFRKPVAKIKRKR